jgi:hypothetical protein
MSDTHSATSAEDEELSEEEPTEANSRFMSSVAALAFSPRNDAAVSCGGNLVSGAIVTALWEALYLPAALTRDIMPCFPFGVVADPELRRMEDGLLLGERDTLSHASL